MNMDAIPVGVLFAATIIVVVVAIEAGYRLGHFARRRSKDEKESPASTMAGSGLALAAFILAFTFGIVTSRYDARKALVRDEANAIRTAYFRTDVLPEPDRGAAARLLREYVDDRLAAVKSRDHDQVDRAVRLLR